MLSRKTWALILKGLDLALKKCCLTSPGRLWNETLALLLCAKVSPATQSSTHKINQKVTRQSSLALDKMKREEAKSDSYPHFTFFEMLCLGLHVKLLDSTSSLVPKDFLSPFYILLTLSSVVVSWSFAMC